MPTPRFSLVAEGPTDHAVITRILAGHFDDGSVEVNLLQPNPAATQGAPDTFGGWENVLAYITSSRFADAFAFTDFVIVHIDTDVCQEAKFGVATHENGEPLEPRALVERVVGNLKARIGDAVWQRAGSRVLFAVSVDSVECWLLTLYAEPRKKARYHNCLKHLNDALTAKNQKPIGGSKQAKDYERVANPFRKSKELGQARPHNASLARFLEEVERVASAASPSV